MKLWIDGQYQLIFVACSGLVNPERNLCAGLPGVCSNPTLGVLPCPKPYCNKIKPERTTHLFIYGSAKIVRSIGTFCIFWALLHYYYFYAT